MNKLLLFIFLIMNAGFCFGQSDYVLTENKPNSKRRYNTFPVKIYDSINNKSTISSFVKPLAISGKWYDFNSEKFLNENLVSHTYIVVSENDLILEYQTYPKESLQTYLRVDNLNDFQKKISGFYSSNKSEILSLTESPKKDYYLYKIKCRSRHNRKNFFTNYTLIGKKNEHFYWFTIYNIDETNFENFDKFLIDTFNNN